MAIVYLASTSTFTARLYFDFFPTHLELFSCFAGFILLLHLSLL